MELRRWKHISNYLLLFFVLYSFAHSGNVLFDVDGEGKLEQIEGFKGEEMFENLQGYVKLANNFPDQAISVVMKDALPNENPIVNISANSNINIYLPLGSQIFAIIQQPKYERAHPYLLTIIRGVITYSFGPQLPPRNSLHPAVTILQPSPWRAASIKFKSFVPFAHIWYDDQMGGSLYQGSLSLGQETTYNAYEGHVFYCTVARNRKKRIATFTISADQFTYIIEDPANPPPSNLLNDYRLEEEFSQSYLNQTGLHWRHYFGPEGPRPPPQLFMWPANVIGDVHSVTSSEGYWFCEGHKSKCQSQDLIELTLEVISTHPKAFIIPNLISGFEADSIIQLAKPIIKQSSTGDEGIGGIKIDETRTSKNAWVGRELSPVAESVFVRAAHLLHIDENLLRMGVNAEELQVVFYQEGQMYEAHHDWGVRSDASDRLITLLFYLNDMKHPDAGGQTSFPKAANGQGIMVHPGKGSAVMFYNLLEDGNGDDLSLHAALPVLDGEKWLANLWIWDPHHR